MIFPLSSRFSASRNHHMYGYQLHRFTSTWLVFAHVTRWKRNECFSFLFPTLSPVLPGAVCWHTTFYFLFFSHSIEHHILDMLFERNHSLPLNRIDWSTYVVYVCVWARSFQNKLLVEWLVAVLFGYTMKKVEDSSGEMTFSASIRENQREAKERENYSKIIINRFWLFSFPIVASASTKFRWYPVICCIFFSICGKHNTEM